MKRKIPLLGCCLLLTSQLIAKDQETIKANEKWQPPKKKVFSKQEISQECKQFEGKYIGYYSTVFKIENCERRELDYPGLQRLLQEGYKVIPVENETIIKLKKGEPLIEKERKPRSCGKFDNQYISYGAGEILYVNNCLRYSFPDWETYKDHRKKRGKTMEPVLDISASELKGLQIGGSINSIFDEAYKSFPSGEKDLTVIPLKEACSGIDGKVVSYYSHLYKIENCRKRRIDNPELFLKKSQREKVAELSTEQWVSLPKGRPYSDH